MKNDPKKAIYPEQPSIIGNIDSTVEEMFSFIQKAASVIVFVLLIDTILLALIFAQLLWHFIPSLN